MQARGERALMPVVLVAHVVKQALPHADGQFPIAFAHCSHKVEVVGDALRPGPYRCTALALAGSPQLLLDT